VEVRGSRRAARYIRKRGGVLYLWADEDGLLRHATREPAIEAEFRRFHGPGFALNLQRHLNLGERVTIERSPFPPWRLLIAFEFMHMRGEGGGPAEW
jgi:hypothetical protein